MNLDIKQLYIFYKYFPDLRDFVKIRGMIYPSAFSTSAVKFMAKYFKNT